MSNKQKKVIVRIAIILVILAIAYIIVGNFWMDFDSIREKSKKEREAMEQRGEYPAKK